MRASLILFILCTAIFSLYSQDLDAVKEDSLQSEVLNETRSFQLYLPPSYSKYKTSKHYPVIFVLDGERLFDVTRSQVHFLSQTAKTPEAIVVGISNTNRTRDFTPTSTTIGYSGEPDEGLNESGGAESFLDFLENELLPHLESSYRLNGYYLLIGHSFGGLLGAHALAQSSVMDAYVLIDPSMWWDNETVTSSLDAITLSDNPPRLYISSADSDKYSNEIEFMRSSQVNFQQKLTQLGYVPDSNLKTVIYDQDNHGTVPLRSILDGIEFIFQGYLVEGMAHRPSAEFIRSFDAFEERMGHDFPAMEELVTWLGLRKVKEESYQEGLPLLKMNADNYPDSWLVLYNLASTYEEMGEVKLAEEYYLKAQALAPNNPDLLEKLNNRE
ncbi:MAG: alpha/beta hydrolase-fold protein [Bacteroidota bacterium]